MSITIPAAVINAAVQKALPSTDAARFVGGNLVRADGTTVIPTATATAVAALIDGRLVPSVSDVTALARPVLSHRMALGYAARARGETLGALIDGVASGLGASV